MSGGVIPLACFVDGGWGSSNRANANMRTASHVNIHVVALPGVTQHCNDAILTAIGTITLHRSIFVVTSCPRAVEPE